MLEGLIKHYCDPVRIKAENESIFLTKSSVSFEGFLFDEIILREDFEKMILSLDKIYSHYPSAKFDFQKRKLSESLNDINFRGHISLPPIGHKNWIGIAGAQLPESMSRINIQVIKYNSEFVILEITVFFQDKINVGLNNILMSYHYPDFLEEYNVDGNCRYAIVSVKDRKKQHIQEYIDNLKKESLIYISSILELGEFFNFKNNDGFNNFPILKFFSFVGYKEEVLNNREHLDIFGFVYNPFMTYVYKAEYFLYEDIFGISNKENEVILLLNRNETGESITDVSPYILLCDFQFYLVSLLRWIKGIHQEIDEITFQISNLKTKFNEFYFLKKKLVRLFFIFEKITTDLTSEKKDRGLFYLIENSKDCKDSFEQSYLNRISYFIKKITPVMERTRSNINNLFELENTKINTSLQNQMRYLTAAALILALLQILK